MHAAILGHCWHAMAMTEKSPGQCWPHNCSSLLGLDITAIPLATGNWQSTVYTHTVTNTGCMPLLKPYPPSFFIHPLTTHALLSITSLLNPLVLSRHSELDLRGYWRKRSHYYYYIGSRLEFQTICCISLPALGQDENAVFGTGEWGMVFAKFHARCR